MGDIIAVSSQGDAVVSIGRGKATADGSAATSESREFATDTAKVITMNKYVNCEKCMHYHVCSHVKNVFKAFSMNTGFPSGRGCEENFVFDIHTVMANHCAWFSVVKKEKY